MTASDTPVHAFGEGSRSCSCPKVPVAARCQPTVGKPRSAVRDTSSPAAHRPPPDVTQGVVAGSCGNCCCRWRLGFSHPLPRVQKGATFTRRRGDACFCIAAPARSSSYTLEQRGASGAVTEQSAVASDAAASPTASAHLDAVAPTPLLFWRW